MPEPMRVIVIGGGAAGFFGAIACAEQLGRRGTVTLFEATEHPLAKVRISGGGRCNVTHACFEPRDLVRRYPRGSRELLGAFHRFQPRDTIAWFAERGVELKTEPDGRMFPVTDDSATIADCLLQAAERAGVQVRKPLGVRMVERIESSRREAAGAAAGDFWVTLTDGSQVRCERVLVTTGGNRSSAGLTIAQKLGHAIEPPVPSLFTFHIEDRRLEGLAGVAFEEVGVAVPGTKLRENGPILITHWGLSGPAILRLSAWGARQLAEMNYEFPLHVNLVPGTSRDGVVRALADARGQHGRRQAASGAPLPVPQRFWERLVTAAGIAPGTTWSQTSKAALTQLADLLTACEFRVIGKSLFKEEFVTCGGVRLSEIDFRTMESRVCPGLHFAGEVLDIDGITGGFNFQSAWTTGWIAGHALADSAPPAGT